MSTSRDVDLYPKFISNLFFSPGKTLFQIGIVLKDNPSALSNILEFLEPLVNVIRIELDRNAREGNNHVILYVESKKTSTTRSEIERAIYSSPSALTYKVQESHDGLLIDTMQFPIMATTGVRAIVISQDIFNGILAKIRQKFGSGGDVIIYEQGLAYGENQGAALFSFFGKTKALESIQELIKLYQSVGIGRPTISKFSLENPAATIKMYDSLECQGRKTSVPYSQFIRGHICGLATVLYGRPMKVRETKCIASGDDHCEFQIEPV